VPVLKICLTVPFSFYGILSLSPPDTKILRICLFYHDCGIDTAYAHFKFFFSEICMNVDSDCHILTLPFVIANLEHECLRIFLIKGTFHILDNYFSRFVFLIVLSMFHIG
jgi:hypothetical protein